MNILWLTWKDQFHPAAGGAEVVCRELTKRLTADGHQVTLLTCGYEGANDVDEADGLKTIRVGSNRYTHAFQALGYFARNLRNSFDIIIEEVNAGVPYFSVFFDRRGRRFLLYHQLARKNWYFETPPPLSQLGHYVLEPAATRLLSLSKVPVITVSESTRQDLARHGFPAENSHIISEGIEIPPTKTLGVQKFTLPTILSLGTMRAMKRTLDQVKAFEIAKKRLPALQMVIAGDNNGAYGRKVMAYIKESQHSHDIEYLGRVSREQKRRLMQKAHLITVTSVKEGWGLIVSEAASQGTPAVVYDVDGLRDSVRHNQTGLVTPERPDALADAIVAMIHDPDRYERLRKNGWQWSKRLTFDQSYRDFKKILELA